MFEIYIYCNSIIITVAQNRFKLFNAKLKRKSVPIAMTNNVLHTGKIHQTASHYIFFSITQLTCVFFNLQAAFCNTHICMKVYIYTYICASWCIILLLRSSAVITCVIMCNALLLLMSLLLLLLLLLLLCLYCSFFFPGISSCFVFYFHMCIYTRNVCI